MDVKRARGVAGPPSKRRPRVPPLERGKEVPDGKHPRTATRSPPFPSSPSRFPKKRSDPGKPGKRRKAADKAQTSRQPHAQPHSGLCRWSEMPTPRRENGDGRVERACVKLPARTDEKKKEAEKEKKRLNELETGRNKKK